MVLVLVSAAVMLPAALHAPMTHVSFGLDYAWTRQFSDGLARGNLYPRWLPDAFGGLGAPVFYFYPPLAFYLASALHLSGLTVWLGIVGAAWIMLAASGLTMQAWTGSQGAALLYMLAPYHLFCFYVRGDLAEFGSYAWAPLIALAIRDRRWVLLAVGYAALILTHVPSTLLLSALAIGPYVLWQRQVIVIVRAGLALCAGAGLAACYLVPAVALQRYASLDSLAYTAFYQPESWAFWNIAHAPSLLSLLIVVAFTGAAVMVAAAIGLNFWTAVALAACACVAGLPIWLLPVFDHLQFPYRALAVADFALCTALAGRSLPIRRWLIPIPAICVVAAGVALANAPINPPTEADEYLPAGYLARHAVVRFAQLPPVAVKPGQIHAFWFPGWSCPHSTTRPAADSYLVEFAEPDCHPQRVATAPEKLGGALSALTVVGLLLFLALARWRSTTSKLLEPKPAS